MIEVVLALGSNLGDRAANLRTAIDRLDFLTDLKSASFHEYPALLPESYQESWDVSFLNTAVIGSTSLQPLELFKKIKDVEKSLGRDPQAPRWSPRIIDIDIIFYGDLVFSTPELTIPHPEAHKRKFVLEPIAEIAPNFNHPTLKRNTKELLIDLGC